MPQQPMPLSPQRLDAIATWMDSKGIGQCPLCRSGTLEVQPYTASVPLSNYDGSAVFVSQYYPCISLLCRHCGGLSFVNPLAIDLQ